MTPGRPPPGPGTSFLAAWRRGLSYCSHGAKEPASPRSWGSPVQSNFCQTPREMEKLEEAQRHLQPARSPF